MIIYPAIDLRHGRCIRLYQGDYQQETIYSDDPLAIANQFAEAGASWLHVVDLDAAKNPEQHQRALITRLINATNIHIQTGGGIRTKQQAEALLELGAARVIIGSLAIENPAEVSRWLQEFGLERLVLALDIKFNNANQPMIAMHGWEKVSAYALFELINLYQPAGLKHVICTNIALDGTLNGPDYALYETLLTQFPFLS